MTDELKFPANGESSDTLGEPIVSLMREAYGPPDAAAWPAAYWSGLERRIMSRVAEADRGWWADLVPWVRGGLVAAAAIFALASIVNQQISATEDQVAYEAIAQPDLTSASDEPIAAQYVSTENDATALRYFLSR
jgi:hypothetical protein